MFKKLTEHMEGIINTEKKKKALVKLIEQKITMSEMKNILDEINGRLDTAKKILVNLKPQK